MKFPLKISIQPLVHKYKETDTKNCGVRIRMDKNVRCNQTKINVIYVRKDSVVKVWDFKGYDQPIQMELNEER